MSRLQARILIPDSGAVSIVTIAATIQAHLDLPGDSGILAIPDFTRDGQGGPRIGLDAENLYAYGHRIHLTEQFILDRLARGLVSGSTYICLGQEIASSVVRALDHSWREWLGFFRISISPMGAQLSKNRHGRQSDLGLPWPS
jgi:hypothetical protein